MQEIKYKNLNIVKKLLNLNEITCSFIKQSEVCSNLREHLDKITIARSGKLVNVRNIAQYYCIIPIKNEIWYEIILKDEIWHQVAFYET